MSYVSAAHGVRSVLERSAQMRKQANIATFAAVLALVTSASGALAGSALAGTEDFFSGNLYAGEAYASSSAHTDVDNIATYSDHTVCPANSVGYAGYTYSPNGGGNATDYDNCGYGYASWAPIPVDPEYSHGAAWNMNGATTDDLSYAYYDW